MATGSASSGGGSSALLYPLRPALAALAAMRARSFFTLAGSLFSRFLPRNMASASTGPMPAWWRKLKFQTWAFLFSLVGTGEATAVAAKMAATMAAVRLTFIVDCWNCSEPNNLFEAEGVVNSNDQWTLLMWTYNCYLKFLLLEKSVFAMIKELKEVIVMIIYDFFSSIQMCRHGFLVGIECSSMQLFRVTLIYHMCRSNRTVPFGLLRSLSPSYLHFQQCPNPDIPPCQLLIFALQRADPKQSADEISNLLLWARSSRRAYKWPAFVLWNRWVTSRPANLNTISFPVEFCNRLQKSVLKN